MKTLEEIRKLNCTEYDRFVLEELIPQLTEEYDVTDVSSLEILTLSSVYCFKLNARILMTPFEKSILVTQLKMPKLLL